MTRVVIAPTGVAAFPDGGGHFWVYAQYAHGLRALGCDVWWIERVPEFRDERVRDRALATFFDRMRHHGLASHAALWQPDTERGYSAIGSVFGHDRETLLAELAGADLILNFDYSVDHHTLGARGTTALVDIDPGLLQFWVDVGQVVLPHHDRYVTIGETVGTERARFGDCGVEWTHIKPIVALDQWPVTPVAGDAYTTISSWWGGAGKGEWITDGKEVFFENNKRVTFLQFSDLPHRVDVDLELATYLGDGDPTDIVELEPDWEPAAEFPAGLTDYRGDAIDMAHLRSQGWRVVHSADVAGDPDGYRRYIQQSLGEFSCVKPSCLHFDNAWISDRTICYLASGRPAVVQYTGESAFLPDAEGLFRFRSADEAVAAFEQLESRYAVESDAARSLAETHFDAARVLPKMLDEVLG